MTAASVLSESISLLACQLAIEPTRSAEQRDKHLRDASTRVRQALSTKHAELVVLPELSAIEYSRDSFAALDELAEPLDGPSFRTWSALAREFDTTIVYGFPRRASGGDFRICAGVVGASGELLGYYDKLHLAQFGASMEQEYFRAGEHLFVFELNGFRLAPIICFDIRPPELCRTLVVDLGVDVILHSGAYYRDPSFYSWHAFAQTRAVENQVYFLSLNRAGQHYGNSLFVPPWIDETKAATGFPDHEESLQYFKISKQPMTAARRDFAFLAERLPSYKLPLLDL